VGVLGTFTAAPFNVLLPRFPAHNKSNLK